MATPAPHRATPPANRASPAGPSSPSRPAGAASPAKGAASASPADRSGHASGVGAAGAVGATGTDGAAAAGAPPRLHDRPFSGQTALVTGGARRIGRVLCRRLAAVGANVVVHHHTSGTEALSLVEQLRSLGVRAAAVHADLDALHELEGLLPAAQKAIGSPVTLLVNNASTFPEGRLDQLSFDAWAASARTNAWAPFELTRRLHAVGTNRGRAAVVNVLDSRITDADWDHVAYHLAKRSLADLTRMAALQFAPRLTVNAVAPGAILAPDGLLDAEAMMDRAARAAPMRRNADPDDVADAVLYLLGARSVTGQTVFVDGGRHLRHGGA